MNHPTLAYLVSLGIVAFGVIWVVAGMKSATWAIWIAIGVLTIAVGLISLLTEIRDDAH
jgi:uncharacterized membrane protein YcjF (UPF0283 family)